MQINLSGAQAETLARLIGENGDGGDLLLTRGHDGAIIAAFELKTFTIDADGNEEEN